MKKKISVVALLLPFVWGMGGEGAVNDSIYLNRAFVVENCGMPLAVEVAISKKQDTWVKSEAPLILPCWAYAIRIKVLSYTEKKEKK